MESKGIKYEFTSVPWQYTGPARWYFMSLPHSISNEIREHLKFAEEGWGRLKATAQIGKTVWKTSIWFDTKAKTYLLPLKTEIRIKEKIETGKTYETCIWV